MLIVNSENQEQYADYLPFCTNIADLKRDNSSEDCVREHRQDLYCMIVRGMYNLSNKIEQQNLILV